MTPADGLDDACQVPLPLTNALWLTDWLTDCWYFTVLYCTVLYYHSYYTSTGNTSYANITMTHSASFSSISTSSSSSSTSKLHHFFNSDDEHKYLCLAFLLLGIGHLIPWMAIIAAGRLGRVTSMLRQYQCRYQYRCHVTAGHAQNTLYSADMTSSRELSWVE
jgi:hypothetical protein